MKIPINKCTGELEKIVNHLRLSLFIVLFALTGCNAAVQNWVGKAKPPKLPIPSIPVASPTQSTPVPGYAFSAAGQRVASASYKLHVRVGKAEAMGTVSSTTYKLRTGLTRHIKDQ